MSTRPDNRKPRNNRNQDGDYIPSPDRNNFNKELQSMRDNLNELLQKVKQQRADIEKSRKNERSPEEQKVREKLGEVVSERNRLRDEENKVKEEIKRFELDINRKIAEAKKLRSSKGPRSVKELESRIESLEKDLESGELSIVKEQSHLREVTALKTLRISYAEADKIQEEIDEIRKKVDTCRKGFDANAMRNILNEKNELQKSADQFNEERKQKRDSTNTLYDARRKTQKEIDVLKAAMDKLRADFKAENEAFTKKLEERKKRRQEEQRIAKIAAGSQKKIDTAQAKLDAAKQPAFDHQISVANSMLRYFKNMNPKKNAKLQFDITAVEGLTVLNVPVPMKSEDLPELLEKIEEKIKYYTENSERVTKEKVERAQKDLDAVLASVEKQKQEKEESKPEAEAKPETEAEVTESKPEEKSE